jgi:Mitotic checkpoint regulator, MAD2B-interacting
LRQQIQQETSYTPTGRLVGNDGDEKSKKKHHITFLAHKAKANEAELQVCRRQFHRNFNTLSTFDVIFRLCGRRIATQDNRRKTNTDSKFSIYKISSENKIFLRKPKKTVFFKTFQVATSQINQWKLSREGYDSKIKNKTNSIAESPTSPKFREI